MHKRQAAVSIIVVNYDEWELSAACLRSLHELAYPRERFEVIFVDNASKYHPAAGEISPDFGNLRVIRNKTNEGFVRAVNRGIRCARRDAAYIALVNNDSVVDRGWLRALVAAMEQVPEAGCCGAREESCGNSVAIRRQAFEGNWMGGGSVLYRKSALDETGLFDEFYFAYCEDVDLSWRMKTRGWKIICAPDALWYHHGAGRVIKANDRRLFLSLRNRLYLLLKFAGFTQMCRSLIRYARHLLLGRPEDSRRAAADDSSGRVYHSAKLRYALRAVFEVGCALPSLWVKRSRIRRRSRVSQEQIDTWIRANDAYVTLNF